MSEKKFSIPEALTVIYRCMMQADGKAAEEEGEAIVNLVKKYVDHAEMDLGATLNNAMDFFKSNDMDENYAFALSAAAQLHNVYEHGTLVMIAKDLVYIAMSDGEVAKQEELFWADCLKAMGVTPADIKDSNDE